MGEIAEMMLDGTMDPETGEWNFDGEDGPGWPMTGAEAAAYKRAMRPFRRASGPAAPAFKLSKSWRKKIEALGVTVQNHDAYHWTIRRNGAVVADWWPHRNKWRMQAGNATAHGNEAALVIALRQSLAVRHA